MPSRLTKGFVGTPPSDGGGNLCRWFSSSSIAKVVAQWDTSCIFFFLLSFDWLTTYQSLGPWIFFRISLNTLLVSSFIESNKIFDFFFYLCESHVCDVLKIVLCKWCWHEFSYNDETMCPASFILTLSLLTRRQTIHNVSIELKGSCFFALLHLGSWKVS